MITFEGRHKNWLSRNLVDYSTNPYNIRKYRIFCYQFLFISNILVDYLPVYLKKLGGGRLILVILVSRHDVKLTLNPQWYPAKMIVLCNIINLVEWLLWILRTKNQFLMKQKMTSTLNCSFSRRIIGKSSKFISHFIILETKRW